MSVTGMSDPSESDWFARRHGSGRGKPVEYSRSSPARSRSEGRWAWPACSGVRPRRYRCVGRFSARRMVVGRRRRVRLVAFVAHAHDMAENQGRLWRDALRSGVTRSGREARQRACSAVRRPMIARVDGCTVGGNTTPRRSGQQITSARPRQRRPPSSSAPPSPSPRGGGSARPRPDIQTRRRAAAPARWARRRMSLRVIRPPATR